jgi:hypothetical protein
MTGKLYAESLRILTEKTSREGMPDVIPRTWILTRRDRALAPKMQRKYIEALGGVQTLIDGYLPPHDGRRAGTTGGDPRRTLLAVHVAPIDLATASKVPGALRRGRRAMGFGAPEAGMGHPGWGRQLLSSFCDADTRNSRTSGARAEGPNVV